MTHFANTPKPPYYAVVFTSVNADVDHSEHEARSADLLALATELPGFLGMEAARDADGRGVAVTYWRDLEAIWDWARHPVHRTAKVEGKRLWYSHYLTRICKVEREYGRPDFGG